MDSAQFLNVRQYLGKTQTKLGHMLCISTKSVQSFEQGWRKIPANVERQLLYLLSIKRGKERKIKPCWRIKKCPIEWKVKCSAWELKAGHTCWFINGTYCEGNEQKDWQDKIEVCRECQVFQSILPNKQDNGFCLT